MSNRYEWPSNLEKHIEQPKEEFSESDILEKDDVREARDRIEKAGDILLKKYGKFEDCRVFIEYICRMESFFAIAEINNWQTEDTKRDMMDIEFGFFAQKTHFGRNILDEIYSEFKFKHSSINQIEEAGDRLIEKYKNLNEEEYEDYCEFIKYLMDICEFSLKAGNPDFNLDEDRKRLVTEKISQLTSDGTPKPKELEEIYQEFQIEVEK
jgi:hypothetical protein